MQRDLQRQLASDTRAGTFARRKARTDQRAYVRRNWRWLAAAYVSLTGMFIVPALFESNDVLRGLVIGLGLAGVAGVLVATIIIQTGTGPTMAGELAEQWTAQELRAMTDHGYRLANHINVDGRGDADHILVGPGGLFVLETKWSATDWSPDDRFFKAPLSQVQSKARNSWLQMKRHGVASATPVLVLWGAAEKGLGQSAGVRRKDDTYVVGGNHLRRWLLGRPRGVLTAAQVDAVYAAVCTLAERGDKVEASVPLSAGQLYARAVTAFALATTAFTAPLLAVRRGLLAYVAAAAACSISGILLRRRARIAGLAVVAGSVGSIVVGLVAFGVAFRAT